MNDSYFLQRLDQLEAVVKSIPEGKNYDEVLKTIRNDLETIRATATHAASRTIPTVPEDLVDTKRLHAIVRPAFEDVAKQVSALVEETDAATRAHIKSTLGQIRTDVKAAELIASNTANVAADMLRMRASYFARG